MERFEEVASAVRAGIQPDAEERRRLRAAVRELTERAEAAIADLSVDADVIQVGSTARGTWTSGDRDIDLFVRFPPDLDREELESFGLKIGHAVLPDGHEEYAEHPYVKGEFDGFDVDFVPCYRVESATDIQSAVDRTPFHTQYLEARLDDELAGEVLLFKQFLKGIGAYGSDLRTKGFSGFLAELLVLEYGSFRGVLEAAAEWTPQVHFDPEDHGTATFDDPLVVIDPTDPERNVAAVLSAENVARLQHYARDLLTKPRESVFFPESPKPLTADDVREFVAERGTTPVAIRFDAPDIVEDQLYPQLQKSLSGVSDALSRRGFDVLRSELFADDTAVLFFELSVAERPAIERHDGPPVHVRAHATGFYEKYADSDAYGPFIDGDRYVVEREREFTNAVSFLRSDAVLDAALGVHVESAMKREYDVLSGDEVGALAAEFGTELARYFDPVP
ncbi:MULTISPECIES: CCA tRNA nucleotidyltransferase [unclassified Haladaptatus]|uniref:CCA tRNA nucleotidyltransferase n=1 Tax=unclassified Haladaptatus TaxID=2622732 RepID=UPI00209C57DF|nr:MULTISPECIES: CCA tRNA nucleotidyltransferase [unclassified Haladaptatus]MCO8246956.1 CCA tRNA nucleotidyltransferase [Haladaptatus sp. AB643]MCO8253516.1 CCA tRNA nucleotidyltransferase [Haladaptatus sp. AB618]